MASRVIQVLCDEPLADFLESSAREASLSVSSFVRMLLAESARSGATPQQLAAQARLRARGEEFVQGVLAEAAASPVPEFMQQTTVDPHKAAAMNRRKRKH